MSTDEPIDPGPDEPNEPREPSGDGAGGAATPTPTAPPGGRARLSILVGLIIVLVVASNLANAFFPTLSTEYPLVLIALSSANRNLILASGQLPFAAYFVVAAIRLILPDAAFYYLGYWYGDRAIVWMERRTPRLGMMMRQLEDLFGRYGHAIVVLFPLLIPSNPVCLVAGASRMRPRVFWVLNLFGIVLRVVVMAWIGQLFEDAVTWLLDAIATYRIPLTIITVGLVGFTFWRETHAGSSDIQQLLDLEDEIEEDLGAESSDPD